MSRTRHPRFVIELEALPADLDADYRLKGALKVLLRRFGFKCRSAILVKPEPPEAS